MLVTGGNENKELNIGLEHMQVKEHQIQIVSLRKIAKKNDLNREFVRRRFKWYANIYEGSSEHLVRTADGRVLPTIKFIEFLERILGRKIDY